MLKQWEFTALILLAVCTTIVVLFNMQQFGSNRELQFEVNQRAQFVQQTVPLETLSREIALALAQLGVRSQDEQIRALLNSLGITVNVNQPPAASLPTTPPLKGLGR